MSKITKITHLQVISTLLLAFGMAIAYLAGTISVEARWFAQDETRATTDQIAAVSAAVSLLLMEEEVENIYLPLIVR